MTAATAPNHSLACSTAPRTALDRLSTQRSGPVAACAHGLFMRAVAWSLLTGISAPGEDEMRGFRSFANRRIP